MPYVVVEFCFSLLECVSVLLVVTIWLIKIMFSSYSVNISQKQSRGEESTLMWGTAWQFTSGLRAWKCYILGLSSLLLSHHNWSVRTLLSESSDKWSAAVMSESSETPAPKNQNSRSTLESHSQKHNACIWPLFWKPKYWFSDASNRSPSASKH